MPASPSLYIERSGPLIRFWGLFRQACVAAYEDNCFGIAKGAAYSSLLAFFPVLASIAAILAQVNADSVAHVLSRFLFEVVPPGTEDLVRSQFSVKGSRPVWLIVAAAILSAWAASGALMSIMEGFQAAYRLPSGRPFVKQRGIALLLVFIGAVPAIGSSALILFGARTERSVLGWLGLLPAEDLKSWVILVSSLLRYAVALAATVVVTALLYCVGPNRPLKLRTVWPGAILATFLWLAATSGFAWYVRNIANYSVLYGSIGAVIALLVWMYVLSVITLVGCEYNAVRERVAAEF
ncbi:MAG TPA: YihY/virulence factor BrkB family protein [Bryobacteraceae bacterium]|nr:YihY/virulence factor BrkB family protein [Bryobacteraceae bacterium]